MAKTHGCSECLSGIEKILNSVSGANVCVLSIIKGDRIVPLTVVGAKEVEFKDDSFQKFLLRCASLQKSQQTVRLFSDNTERYSFFKLHKIGQHAEIPFNFDSDTHLLLSLFYNTSNNISQDRLQGILETIPCFKNAFFTISRKMDGWNQDRFTGFDNIVGQSTAMSKVFNLINLVAKTDASVLIIGETGTGKELIARAIHNHSLRKDGAFIAVDCVAIPINLLESELFGFEKGAFTGATGQKYGLIEFAHCGTLFLDEISEMDKNFQAKLLRVLQEKKFRRIGGEKLITADIRVIAAMNRNPANEVAEGRFRRDLYYRLNVIPINVPPLRKRKEDISLLANSFLKNTIKKNKLGLKVISPAAMELLTSCRWPGNVRQLQNIIERIALLCSDTIIEAEDVQQIIFSACNRHIHSTLKIPYKDAKRKHLEIFKKMYFQNILKKCRNNITMAAKTARVSERTVYRMIERFGVAKKR